MVIVKHFCVHTRSRADPAIEIVQIKELRDKVSKTEPPTSVDQAHVNRPRDSQGG